MFLCLFISSFNKINFSVFYVLCAFESLTQSINSMKTKYNMAKRFHSCHGSNSFFLRSPPPYNFQRG
jgi:hypothetical protein